MLSRVDSILMFLPSTAGGTLTALKSEVSLCSIVTSARTPTRKSWWCSSSSTRSARVRDGLIWEHANRLSYSLFSSKFLLHSLAMAYSLQRLPSRPSSRLELGIPSFSVISSPNVVGNRAACLICFCSRRRKPISGHRLVPEAKLEERALGGQNRRRFPGRRYERARTELRM